MKHIYQTKDWNSEHIKNSTSQQEKEKHHNRKMANYMNKQITKEETQRASKHKKILNLTNNHKLLKRRLKNNETSLQPLR